MGYGTGWAPGARGKQVALPPRMLVSHLTINLQSKYRVPILLLNQIFKIDWHLLLTMSQHPSEVQTAASQIVRQRPPSNRHCIPRMGVRHSRARSKLFPTHRRPTSHLFPRWYCQAVRWLPYFLGGGQ